MLNNESFSKVPTICDATGIIEQIASVIVETWWTKITTAVNDQWLRIL